MALLDRWKTDRDLSGFDFEIRTRRFTGQQRHSPRQTGSRDKDRRLGAPVGAVFKDRRRTGEIIPPDAPGRDPIVTRILWLRGLEPQNAQRLSPLHLHSRHTGRTKHRTAGELWLCAHAIARRHSALRHRRAWRAKSRSSIRRCTRSIRRFFRLARVAEQDDQTPI